MAFENWDNLTIDELDYRIYHNQPCDPDTRKELTTYYKHYGARAYKRAIEWFHKGWFNINRWGVPTVSKKGIERIIRIENRIRSQKEK